MPTSQELRQRLDLAETFLLREEGVWQAKSRALQEITSQVQALTREEEILRQTELAVTEISQRVLGNSTKAIDKLITGGLRAVFKDQSLEFKTVVGRYRGKTSLELQLYHNGLLSPLMDSYGGGVIAVVGVLLMVVTVMVMGLRRVLILDETLAHVSVQYVPDVSDLLRKLAKELGFTIVLVTHAESFAEEADVHYLAKESGPDTVVFHRQTAPGDGK